MMQAGILTACISELPEALSRARAPSDELTFCLLTSEWDEPGSSSAGRFSADIMRAASSKRELEMECCLQAPVG